MAAKDLELGKVDLIYSVSTSVTLAVKKATARTPIVFYAGFDPVAAGFVESLARPGGRLTGVLGRTTDLTAKRMQILKEIVPRLHRAMILHNPDNLVSRENLRLAHEAAQKLGVQLVERPVRSVEELRSALAALKPRDADAFFQIADAMVTGQAQLIIDAALANKWPTMFYEYSLVLKGGLAGYGQNYHEIGRLSAKHVQRVLAGIQPKDLPVENYDKIELALNLRTAREIGLTIPPAIRAVADKVIQ